MANPIDPHRAGIADLCRRFHVRRLDLFGSATGDAFDPATSDVDFLVEFDPAGDVNLFEAYIDLRRALADLLGRPVDLVMPSAVRNPWIAAGIAAGREAVYAA